MLVVMNMMIMEVVVMLMNHDDSNDVISFLLTLSNVEYRLPLQALTLSSRSKQQGLICNEPRNMLLSVIQTIDVLYMLTYSVM